MSANPVAEAQLARTIRSIVSMLGVGVLLFALAGPAAADRSDPIKVVETFHATLLEVMKGAKALGYEGRHRLLAPAIDEAFRLRLMSRMVAGGRRWKRFSKAEKESFVGAFSGLVAATYAHRFDGYSGQSFKILGTAPLRPKTVLVKTSIVGSKREDTKLNYLLRQFKDGWHVIDVYLKGAVSEVATKRSEYSGILRKEGVNALVKRIMEKTAELAAMGSR